MGKIWSRNSSGTYGPQCPDGHGVLLSDVGDRGRLFCPHSGHGGNGQFFASDDPSIVEGRSPGTDQIMAAVREEAMRAEAATRAHREVVEEAKRARTRDALGGRRPTSQTPPSRAAEAGTGPECLCGCGERTKGGRFRPGHDARYHAAQKRAGHAEATAGA